MANVIHPDTGTPEGIWRHAGFSSTISDSFSSPSTYPTGVAWDGSNVISCDDDSAKIYLHTGFSSTISNSFSSWDSQPYGVTWDGDNAIESTIAADRIFRYAGFSSTISNSFSSPSNNPQGVSWDGTNILCVEYFANKVYLHNGFSTTISNSFALTWPVGVSWDGENALVRSLSLGFTRHLGFSSTITDSFTSGDSQDVEWDERLVTNKFAIFLFKDRLGAVTNATVTWNGRTNLAPTVSTVYLQAYNQTTSTWTTIDSENLIGADTDFDLIGNLPTGGTVMSDFLDAENLITHRVYQQKL